MKNLTNPIEATRLRSQIDDVLACKRNLPAQIFRPEFSGFRFLPFDVVLMAVFFSGVRRFMLTIREHEFFVAAIKPDFQWYLQEFNEGGIFLFDDKDQSPAYIAALHDFPSQSRADALAHNATSILLSSQTRQWAIFADHDADLAICAFKSSALASEFDRIFSDDLLPGVEAAAQYAYGECGTKDEIEQFVRNYSSP